MSVHPGFRRSATVAAVLCLLAAAPLSHAITFEQLDVNGQGTGTFYQPSASDWVLAPDATAADLTQVGAGWQIDVGAASFGAVEGGQQVSGIFGAGVLLPSSSYGWRVNFDANLRTWDSYNDGSVVAPNPGGSLGDWDLFAVNANSTGYYWNLVANGNTGAAVEGGPSSGLVDPLVPVRPAGSVVSFNNTTGNPAYLPGQTWAWGGRDYAAGYFESVHTTGAVVTGSAQPQYVSFVLDSRTPPFNDTNYPSWGRFGVVGLSPDVPGGSSGTGPGSSVSNPILPIESTGSGLFEFAPVTVGENGAGLDYFLYFDPVVAVGYEFATSGQGPKVKSLVLPTLGDADGYTIEVRDDKGNWVKVGAVADGGTFTFDTPVDVFRVVGIDPSLGLNPGNTAAFVTGLKFDGAGQAGLEMKALTTNVPEPSDTALALAGLATAGLVLRRRAQRAA